MEERQRKCVARVLRSQSCLYSVLELREGCTDEDVARQYKLLARLLHPDKNKLPKAEEAFKLVGLAKETLGTAKGREKYNWRRQMRPSTGSAFSDNAAGGHSPFHGFGGGGARHRHRQPGSAEEYFEEMLRQMFAEQMQSQRGAGGRTRRPRRGQPPPHFHFVPPRRQAEPMPYLTKCLLLAVVIFLYVLFALVAMDTTPAHMRYSMDRSRHYPHEHVTENGARYFMATAGVPPNPDLVGAVEQDWFYRLQRRCWEEEAANARQRKYQRYVDPSVEAVQRDDKCSAFRSFKAATGRTEDVW